jgi:hypothetical protein
MRRRPGELFGLADVDRVESCAIENQKNGKGGPMKQTHDGSGANDKSGGTKRRGGRAHWLLAAAVAAAVPLLSLTQAGSAQYASQNDGRARDANTRVGSNGTNPGGARGGTAVTPNNIVYGNVTRGQEFRGPVGSTDPRAFRGDTADTSSSSFIRDSSGAAVRGNANLNSTYTAQPFYGSERAVAPPAGVVPLGTAGGYVAPTAQQALVTIKPGQINNPYAYPDPFYTGEGGILNTPVKSRFGSSVLPGQTLESQEQSLLLLSPLAGMREASLGQLNGYFYSQTGRSAVGVPTDRFRATQAEIDRMRAEYNNGANNGNGNNPNDTTDQQNNPQQIGRPAAQPFETPDNSPLPNGQLNSSIAGQPLSNQARTGQGTSVVRPGDVRAQAVRDTQVTELKRRLDRYATESGQNPPPSGATAAPGAPTAPGAPAAPGTPGSPPRQSPAGGPSPAPLPNPAARPGTGAPGTTTRPAAAPVRQTAPPGAAVPQPVEIKSFAAGVPAPGLRQTLATAEQQMREGKFASALDQYDVAEQVAPNNPLIWLGKADAELGASSYRTAETHIRQAFNADHALLMGRYDLNSLIGPARVDVLRKDLADIAQANPNDPMAPFLLGYIAYNTGSGPQAATYLAEAERRAGRADPTIALIRQHWNLTATAARAPAASAAPAATTRPAAAPAAPPRLNK